MLVRTIVIALPLVLGAAQARAAESSEATKEKKDQQSGAAGDSVPGHGHAGGALGNAPDTTGAKGGGGAASRAGTEGRKDEAGAGERGDTTSGGPAGTWDGSSGKSYQASGKRGHEKDLTLTGKLSQLSDDSVTIESAQGERHTLKIVPQTRFTLRGKAAQRTQLEEGQEVRASYAEQAGEQIAVRIEASPEAAKASGGSGTAKKDEKKSEKKTEK